MRGRRHPVRIGVNNIKTSASRSYKKQGEENEGCICVNKLHAETNAMIWARPRDILFIYRWTKSGIVKPSRPCEFCMEVIKKTGIARIYYHDNMGNVIRENV